MGLELRAASRAPARLAASVGVSLPEIDVHDFRRSGYLPGVLCNFLALLGWNPGGDVERFDNAFLAENFGTGRIGKSPSKFDRTKLLAFTDSVQDASHGCVTDG